MIEDTIAPVEAPEPPAPDDADVTLWLTGMTVKAVKGDWLANLLVQTARSRAEAHVAAGHSHPALTATRELYVLFRAWALEHLNLLTGSGADDDEALIEALGQLAERVVALLESPA